MSLLEKAMDDLVESVHRYVSKVCEKFNKRFDDVESLYMSLEKKISEIPAGKDGKDGADGRDGKDGRDGADGKDGVSVDPAQVEAMVGEQVSKQMQKFNSLELKHLEECAEVFVRGLER